MKVDTNIIMMSYSSRHLYQVYFSLFFTRFLAFIVFACQSHMIVFFHYPYIKIILWLQLKVKCEHAQNIVPVSVCMYCMWCRAFSVWIEHVWAGMCVCMCVCVRYACPRMPFCDAVCSGCSSVMNLKIKLSLCQLLCFSAITRNKSGVRSNEALLLQRACCKCLGLFYWKLSTMFIWFTHTLNSIDNRCSHYIIKESVTTFR